MSVGAEEGEHGDQLARLRDEPSLIPAAVEEILRYDGSVQMRGVSAGDDLAFDATEIRAGEPKAVPLALGR